MLDYPYQNHTTNLQQVFILICVQKIYFIPHFFLKILQRNSKLVILGNLGMAGHTYLKLQQQFDEIFDVYLWTFILHIFLVILQRYCKLMALGRYCKDMQASYFGHFGHDWLHTPNMMVLACRRLSYLSAGQKYTSPFTSFLRYCILKNPAI